MLETEKRGRIQRLSLQNDTDMDPKTLKQQPHHLAGLPNVKKLMLICINLSVVILSPLVLLIPRGMIWLANCGCTY